MSQDERDIEVGRIIREKREATEHAATIKSRINRLGERMLSIGSQLRDSPSTLAFQGRSCGANGLPDVQWISPSDYPSLEEIVSLGNDLRESEEKLYRVTERAKNLGV